MIVFLAVNSSYSHSMPSYGCLRALAEREAPGWTWGLVETTLKEDSALAAKAVSRRFRRSDDALPSLLLGTVYLFNRDKLLEICRLIKERMDDVSIILGGPEFWGDNERFLSENGDVAAAVNRGDESGLPELLRKIESGREWNGVPGLCFIDSEGLFHDGGTAEFAGSLDDLPSPFAAGFFAASKPFLHFETSRGCPGRCAFCCGSLSRRVKTFSLARIREDLAAARGAGVRKVRVLDRDFNTDSGRAVSLLKMFSAEFASMRFHLEVNPASLDDSFITALEAVEPGCLHLEAGVQSFDPAVSRAINRFGSVVDTEQGLRKLVSLPGIEVHADLIAGLPKQTIQSLEDDIEVMIDIAPDEIQLELLKVLPGTPLRQSPPEGLVWNERPPYEVLATDSMNKDDLRRAELLSAVIDGFFNVAKSRSCFRFACLHHPRFAVEFTDFCLNRGIEIKASGLERRFEWLIDFADESGWRELRGIIDFSWLAAGLPLTRFGFKPRKISPRDGSLPIIWSDENLVAKRCFEMDFEFNAAELWLDPGVDLKRARYRYQFLLAGGNRVAAIHLKEDDSIVTAERGLAHADGGGR